MSSAAAKLKDEGNALFNEKDYEGAIEKYTAAIVKDPRNAILYCNRAACHHVLKNYSDAQQDAGKATELNPTFAKAWARLAAAQEGLNIRKGAVNNWLRAIDAIPKENQTPAQLKQRQDYEKALEAASAIQNDPPWTIAATMIPDLLQSDQRRSSAHALVEARVYFAKGVLALKNMKGHDMDDSDALLDNEETISSICNAIIMERRVFHMEGDDWLPEYHARVAYETSKHQIPDLTGDLLNFKQGIRQLLESGGWDLARPALQSAISILIMQAFLDFGHIRKDCASSVPLLDKALDILQWGQEEWHDVPLEKLGLHFRRAFIRGVRCLRINHLLRAYQEKGGKDPRFSARDILRGADEVLVDAQSDTPDPTCSPGEEVAFYVNAQAQALAAKGHCLAEIGVVAETREIYQQSLMSAGDNYQEAAAICPQDDEMRQVYAWRLLLCRSCFGTGVMGIFQMLSRHINEIIPATMPIWQNSDRIEQFQQGMGVMTERIMTSTGSGFVDQSNANDLLETTLPYEF